MINKIYKKLKRVYKYQIYEKRIYIGFLKATFKLKDAIVF